MAKRKKIREKNEDKVVGKEKEAMKENSEASAENEADVNLGDDVQAQETEETAEGTIDPQQKIQELEASLEAMNDKYLRLTAEYQNYRKRVEKEKADIYRFGTEKLIADMLPIMDNFERALTAAESAGADEKITSGIELIKKSLDALFEKNGVKKIEALGATFDPERHHAVLAEEKEGVESDQVIEVLQDGYVLNEKVIRPSMVKVSS
ncbi:MAG: molecular chaperone GrpE [Clostridiales bacterium]|nr:molecular chaperone GrpE [Clostridiales bacterium]